MTSTEKRSKVKGRGKGKMNLLEKLRQERFKRMGKKKIKQGFVALVWLSKRQMELGWTHREKKSFWKDFIYSPETRERCIVKGIEMHTSGKTHKKEE